MKSFMLTMCPALLIDFYPGGISTARIKIYLVFLLKNACIQYNMVLLSYRKYYGLVRVGCGPLFFARLFALSFFTVKR